MWNTSRWPASSAFLVCAYLSSLSCTRRGRDSPAFSLKCPGCTVNLSEAPGRTEHSTAAEEVFLTRMSFVYACARAAGVWPQLQQAAGRPQRRSRPCLVQADALEVQLPGLEAEQALLLLHGLG